LAGDKTALESEVHMVRPEESAAPDTSLNEAYWIVRFSPS
jgi:hypothetical protein